MTRATQTRTRLQETAVRLFSERGFDNVTVEEVAHAVGVSHMTFFRHYPTKESVVLDDPYDPVLGALITEQDPTLPALEKARRALLEAWEEVEEPGDEMTRARVELAASHPGLRARVWENNQRTADVVVAALIESGSPALEARIAAGAVLGAVTAALFDWAEDEERGTLGDRIRSAMDVLAFDEMETAR